MKNTSALIAVCLGLVSSTCLSQHVPAEPATPPPTQTDAEAATQAETEAVAQVEAEEVAQAEAEEVAQAETEEVALAKAEEVAQAVAEEVAQAVAEEVAQAEAEVRPAREVTVPVAAERAGLGRELGMPGPWRGSSVLPYQLAEHREEAREGALSLRDDRRAFDGAPPTMPHSATYGEGSKQCTDCHTDGIRIAERVGRPMSHAPLANCTQCHVEARNVEFLPGLSYPNSFRGTDRAPKQSTGTLGQPMAIPHPVWMRTRCLSCHGEFGYPGLRTSHPERAQCTQCHPPRGTAAMTISSGISRRGLLFGRLFEATDLRPSSNPAPRPDGFVARVLPTACVAYRGTLCFSCSEHCPIEGAVVFEHGRPHIDIDHCNGCGDCIKVCPAPQQAIRHIPRV